MTDAQLSQLKRKHAPEGFGDECPVCGDPFDPGSAGIVWHDEYRQIDAIAWVRVCTGPASDQDHLADSARDLGYDPAELAIQYIHKDDNLDTSTSK